MIWSMTEYGMEVRGDLREDGFLVSSDLRESERREEREGEERETSRWREWVRERWWCWWRKGVMMWK